MKSDVKLSCQCGVHRLIMRSESRALQLIEGTTVVLWEWVCEVVPNLKQMAYFRGTQHAGNGWLNV